MYGYEVYIPTYPYRDEDFKSVCTQSKLKRQCELVCIPAHIALFVSLSDKVAKEELRSFFEASSRKIYWPLEFAHVLRRYRSAWDVPCRTSIEELMEWILANTRMRAVELKSPTYKGIRRYIWGKEVSPVLIALSLRRDCYLSHGSALWVHGLPAVRHPIYVNHEQREKPPNDGDLTQDGIDRAFRNQPRRTKMIYRFGSSDIILLNGKNTNRLEVRKIEHPGCGSLDVTSIERTLIDISVRPQYAGGVSRVVSAFAAFRDQVEVRRMARVLKMLDYTYPYHQAIGFYLKRAGYSANDQKLFAEMGLRFNFYLCHGISEPIFDPEWRIFYPPDASNALKS